jgi:hypothetical protein
VALEVLVVEVAVVQVVCLHILLNHFLHRLIQSRLALVALNPQQIHLMEIKEAIRNLVL